MKAFRETGCIVPCTLKLLNDGKLHDPISLPQEKNLQYPSDRRLNGSQSQSVCFGIETYLLPLPENKS
jgi:hypothetical protein